MTVQLKREYRVYLKHRDEFVPEHLNDFVLIKGDRIINFYKSYEDALESGLENFGNVPFFIRDVKKEEEIHFFQQRITAH